MKVLQAQVTDVPEVQETNFLRRVLSADPTHPGFQHVYHLLDDFYLEGPNGRHQCIVTELLGEGLDRYAKRFPKAQIPISIVKSILRPVILALMYLHEKCNIIHTDVKSNNILLVPPDGANPSVLPTESPTVKVIDLGVACWADHTEEHWTDLIQSPEFHAPEIFDPLFPTLDFCAKVAIGAGWGTPAEVYELTTGKFLFPHDIHRTVHVSPPRHIL
ncbi:kinase-like domain-containing protein [Roridomyces roridus]|uniref:non-specific serine/threonine protein kinase n=1 Tax=Roridomyces roridus TaxID=1738132 RepID=A0AAD7FX16_9AGAR|nr:kinase-like domain-containing protein [Roridomyces roridus]